MIVTTTFEVEGYRIATYRGIVRGIVVRSPTILQGFVGGLKNLIGGKIGAFTTMCEQTRQQSYEIMVDQAVKLGANAIVGMRYDASQVTSDSVSATEVFCYGTAVILEQRPT